MREVFIVGAARTALGSFMGSLSDIPAPRLGAVAIKSALKKADLASEVVSEVIMGNVLSAGQGQAPARQAALYAGIPNSVPAMTINKVCGSGMQAVILGARIIVTLLSVLKARGQKRGVAGICIGGGEALSICLEML